MSAHNQLIQIYAKYLRVQNLTVVRYKSLLAVVHSKRMHVMQTVHVYGKYKTDASKKQIQLLMTMTIREE
jgi:hypothetical protein